MATKNNRNINDIRDFYTVEDLNVADVPVKSNAASGATTGGWAWRPRYLLSTAKKTVNFYSLQGIYLLASFDSIVVVGKSTKLGTGERALSQGAVNFPIRVIPEALEMFKKICLLCWERQNEGSKPPDKPDELQIVHDEGTGWRVALQLSKNGLDVQRQWNPSQDKSFQEKLAAGERTYNKSIPVDEWRRTENHSFVLKTPEEIAEFVSELCKVCPYALGLDEQEIRILLVITQILLKAEKNSEGRGVTFLQDWARRRNLGNLRAVVEDITRKLDLSETLDYQVTFILENIKGLQFCFESWLTAMAIGADPESFIV